MMKKPSSIPDFVECVFSSIVIVFRGNYCIENEHTKVSSKSSLTQPRATICYKEKVNLNDFPFFYQSFKYSERKGLKNNSNVYSPTADQ